MLPSLPSTQSSLEKRVMRSRFLLIVALWCTTSLYLGYSRLTTCGLPSDFDFKEQYASSFYSSGRYNEEPLPSDRSAKIIPQAIPPKARDFLSNKQTFETTERSQPKQLPEHDVESPSTKTQVSHSNEQHSETTEEARHEQLSEQVAEPPSTETQDYQKTVNNVETNEHTQPEPELRSEPIAESSPTETQHSQMTEQNIEISDHTSPAFWSTVSWREFRARVAETQPSSFCNETQPANLTLVEKTDQSIVGWPGQKKSNGDKTICKFDAREFTFHLPHAMQSIYGCWSLWEAHGGHPVLVGPPDHVGFNEPFKDLFMIGMFKALTDYFNVTITTTDHVKKEDLDNAVHLEIWGGEWYGRPFFLRRDDSWKWTDTILINEHIDRNACQNVVRVGILNRHPGYGRSILNSQEIMEELLRVFGDKLQVDEILFENKNFQEQIQWMASHDIVLTGHGAQETSLNFMPKCGVLLEVFPSSYYVPEYFSALSDTAHVRHYIMNSDRTRDPTWYR
ncbi:hypothetical protein FisN_31Lh088 [Fistulifera solaris]|uniref:Glycosyltransferase 61 catalytic domain-containing protein n=1 Tax=Fistulifera solaris TaxID=1519565 RepID=A0A1Z5K6B9_FISSO|nr:hypothetical protein FisN_31Lh088 [Fistulifera solaris]|eukprot:GAX21797.1 hypothetical protein FisN_31Lh088 [Fistulifera solaris]